MRSRSDRRVSTIPTGTAATEARPKTTAPQARTFAFLLLRVGTSIRGGRDRAADHAGDRNQRQHVRERLEQRRRAVRVRGKPVRERRREAEQERGVERPER